jgi:serine/threonine protein kinase
MVHHFRGADEKPNAIDEDTPADQANVITVSATSDATPAPGPRVISSKQDRDLATAVALLRGGYLSERQLSQITKNWTAFGNVPLVDQAIECGSISAADSDTINRDTDNLLLNATRQATSSGVFLSPSKRDRARLANLDPSGRIGQLLGVSDVSMLSGDEIEDRSVGARYTLLRKLGQGGLGIVWLARDENLQRYVALKEISRETAPNDAALEHFRREAEITGRLEHPSIVPIYQFGRDEKTGKSFYVMRFLGRRTLQDAIAEYHERRDTNQGDSMALHRLLAAFVSVCHAVGHAHARQIIHRDLKPSNVALDEFDQVTLLDWGLAKINDATGLYDVGGRTEPGDLHSMGSTAIGRVIGTPLYMAPEQASGRLEEVDTLTDVYGLGGILYAILTGSGPHQATVDSMETRVGAADVLARIVADSITPPDKVTPNVPPELNAICLKALSAKPYLRYGSAAELAEDVQRYIAGTPVMAYVAPTKRRVSRWMAKHPTLTQTILLMASLVLISGIIVWSTARSARAQLISARYNSAVETARDLEINLRFEADELQRNLHFITELPIMRAIIQSQRDLSGGVTRGTVSGGAMPGQDVGGQPKSDPAPLSGTSQFDTLQIVGLQTPDQWLDRMGDLFDGFLNANPACLMMASCIQQDDQSFRELLRSERVAAGAQAHRVPRKQLMVTDGSTGESSLSLIDSLRPGTVLLLTNDQMNNSIPASSSSPLALSGIAATYDADGEFFGLNVIEIDLRGRLESLLTAVAPEHVTVCITDSKGNIVMDFAAGRLAAVSGSESVVTRYPLLKDFFKDAASESEFGDGKDFFAMMVDIGTIPGTARVGIVVHPVDK